jgi:hypothetical protein
VSERRKEGGRKGEGVSEKVSTKSNYSRTEKRSLSLLAMHDIVVVVVCRLQCMDVYIHSLTHTLTALYVFPIQSI